MLLLWSKSINTNTCIYPFYGLMIAFETIVTALENAYPIFLLVIRFRKAASRKVFTSPELTSFPVSEYQFITTPLANLFFPLGSLNNFF